MVLSSMQDVTNTFVDYKGVADPDHWYSVSREGFTGIGMSFWTCS